MSRFGGFDGNGTHSTGTHRNTHKKVEKFNGAKCILCAQWESVRALVFGSLVHLWKAINSSIIACMAFHKLWFLLRVNTAWSKRHINTDRGEKCQLLFFICHINNFPSMCETDCGWPMRLKFQLWNSLQLLRPLFPCPLCSHVRACHVYTCVYIFTHQYLQVTWLAWDYARR